MKTSRKTLFALIGAMAIGATMAAPSVEIVSVQQQYPWTNTVDIVYNVAGVASDTNGYFVAFTPTTQDGLPIEDINGETSIQVALSCTTNGAVAQWYPQTNQQYTACKMTPAVYRGGSGGGKDYMIVDLENWTISYEPMATQEASNEKYNTDEYKTRKLVLRRIPADTYTIGHSTESSNQPHKTTMGKDYYIGIFELTVAQYERVVKESSTSMEKRPVGSDVDRGAYYPVTWNTIRGHALAGAIPSGSCFFGILNQRFAEYSFDLPTHAMFEVAARAGCTTRWLSGDTSTSLGDYAWIYGNAGGVLHEGGLKKPNAWGLFDVEGNTYEQFRDVAPSPYSFTDENEADGLKPITVGDTSKHVESYGYTHNGVDRMALSWTIAYWNTWCHDISYRVSVVAR